MKYLLILFTSFCFGQFNPIQFYEFGSSKKQALTFTINTNLGTGASMTIPTRAGFKNYTVNWGDGSSTSGETGNATHTYSSHGTYQIKIRGTFIGFIFNNGGDRLKIVSIDNWGDVGYSTDQSNAFYGCSNLTTLSDSSQEKIFNSLTNGLGMFRFCTAITSLPSGITLSNLTNGSYMFQACTALTSLPTGLTLSSLTNGDTMFRDCTALTSLPTGVLLGSLLIGTDMFRFITLNTSRYSQLLIDINSLNPNNTVTFHGGGSKYNSSATASRANLITVKSWTINDGGLE